MTDQLTPSAATRSTITRTQYQTVITGRKHTVIADEPESAGGADTGMKPGELLLASLSSCTAITLQMYINRKMWAVQKIIIDQELFSADNGTLIKSRISIYGELNDEQKKRLEHIADVCPIHKMLTGDITIETVIK